MAEKVTRKVFLKDSLLAGAALAVSSRPADASARQSRPNIVLIVTDDQCYRGIGYNNPIVKTPNIDALARSGVVFDHAYVATPICAASRASILTGLFPQQHGTIALDGAGFKENVVDSGRIPTVAQLLSAAGYDTAFCGKSHLGPPRDYGFSVGDESHDTTDNETFAFAAQFIEGRKDNRRPFFLWIAARQPHLPLLPPSEWLDVYKDADIQVDANFLESPPRDTIYNQGLPGEHYYRDSDYTNNHQHLPAGPPRSREQIREFMRAYYAVVSRLDHQVGEFVEQLRAAGLYENTAIGYLSDNGYHLGNHGLGNKITMHEESVRVPMFVHYPKLAKSGIRSKALVSSLDLFPTLLDFAGAGIPTGLYGKSLVPLLAGRKRNLRDYVASECVGVGGKKGMGHRMVRTDRWKYVLTDMNDEALFDEHTDPFEMTNLANVASCRRILHTMRAHLRHWMRDVGDTHTPPRTNRAADT